MTMGRHSSALGIPSKEIVEQFEIPNRQFQPLDHRERRLGILTGVVALSS
jgi:hypothetical protein